MAMKSIITILCMIVVFLVSFQKGESADFAVPRVSSSLIRKMTHKPPRRHYLSRYRTNENPEDKFARINQNGDNSLTFDEFILRDKWKVDRKREDFDRVDSNNDSQLSFIEFYKQNKWFLRNNEREFDLSDTDNDGVVNETEFLAYYDKLEEEMKERFRGRMNMFDIGDSKLSKEEVEKYLEKSHFMAKEDLNLDEVFEKYDLNKDNFWDLDEFSKFNMEPRKERVSRRHQTRNAISLKITN